MAPPCLKGGAARADTLRMQRPVRSEQASDEERLVRQHLPLVQHLVVSMRGRLPAHVQVDDLTSAAMTGLLGAARSFEPGRGVPFGAYASTRMRGAIMDELRGADWASRGLRARARSLQRVSDTLGVGVSEAAAAAGISEAEARQVVADIHRATVLSIDGLLEADDAGAGLPSDHATPEGSLLDRERVGYLRDAVDALPDRLRHVVLGCFFEERTMAELAQELGVSESRISHMRAEALSLMREAMTSVLNPVRSAGRPPGAAARRRAAYCADVASASDYRARLDRPAPVRAGV